MVAQQLTPELTQPNVLVEIDHGPPKGEYQEARQPARGQPLAQMPDTMSSIKEASASKSSCHWTDPEHSARDIPSIEMESAGTRIEVLKGGSVMSPEGFHNLWQPFWSHGSKAGPTAQDIGKGESLVVGMHHLSLDGVIKPLADGGDLSLKTNLPLRKGLTVHSPTSPGSGVSAFRPPSLPRRSQTSLDDVIDAHKRRMRIRIPHDIIDQTLSASQDEPKTLVDKTFPLPDGLHKHLVDMLDEPEQERRVLRPCPMTNSSGDVGTHPGEARHGALFDTHSADLADAALRGKLESVTGRVSIARISGSVSTMDRPQEGAGCRTLPTPLKHHKVLSKELVEGEGNEKSMAEGDKFAVPGKPRNHFHYDLPTRDICSGPLRGTQSSKKKDVMPVERTLLMSWAAGSKKSFEVVEPEGTAREILMWMIEYNLMTSHCEKQKLLALAHQSLGQLLTLMEAAVSCIRILLLHQLDRNARDKQCTGEVHCLLDDPG